MENKEEATKLGDESNKFLLKEYSYFSESFWRNEEIGERRVNLYLTLATALLSALVLIGGVLIEEKISDINFFVLIAVIGTIGLFILGFVTYLRIIQRNNATDQYQYGMELIRQIFRERDSLLKKKYNPFNWKDETPLNWSNFSEMKLQRRSLWKGGLVTMTLTMNSFIIGASFAMGSYLLFSEWDPILHLLIGFFGIIIGLFLHLAIYRRRMEKRVK